tara:strand:+ start:4749 stop:5006 length:258 start_codon:yes stop_codon:yes gene_type:complete
MNRKRLIIIIIGILLILTGIWGYPKIHQFFKIDSCLDKGGRWNYKTKECEFESNTKNTEDSEVDELSGYNQLADKQNRETYSISE